MESKTVERPWGNYQCLDRGVNVGFQVKRLVVYPHKRLSLQSHNQRSEHWVVVQGTIKCIVGDDTHTLNVNQTVYIPKGVKHRIINSSDDDAVVIETQIGNYLGEDDIVRFEDDYGRQ